MRTEAIENGTDRSWAEWLTFFDRIGAASLDHAALARAVEADGQVTGWWAQAVVIHYEQETGRRVEGQVTGGKFAANASKTVPGDLDEGLARWVALVSDDDAFGGVPLDAEPSSSATEKWRYWRCPLADGSRIQVTVSAKDGGKVVVAVQHDRLESAEDRDRWKAYWRERLTGL
ncbi:MAG: hypothetical protein GX593_14040 [Actinomycetales bacterium]|nr:hypothetical protein [Actinomycetales bacterium]